jgi:hypothetical protein
MEMDQARTLGNCIVTSRQKDGPSAQGLRRCYRDQFARWMRVLAGGTKHSKNLAGMERIAAGTVDVYGDWLATGMPQLDYSWRQPIYKILVYETRQKN